MQDATVATLTEVMQAEGGIEIPGLKEDVDIEDAGVRESVLRQVGRKLKQAFGSDVAIAIDNLRIEREEYLDEGSRERHRYRVCTGT